MISNNSKSSNWFSRRVSPQAPAETLSPLPPHGVQEWSSPDSDCSEGCEGRHQTCISLGGEVQVYALLGEINFSPQETFILNKTTKRSQERFPVIMIYFLRLHFAGKA